VINEGICQLVGGHNGLFPTFFWNLEHHQGNESDLAVSEITLLVFFDSLLGLVFLQQG
jgi:hypothetical protein